MDDPTKAEITARLVQLILALVPGVNLRSMYGGTVIELEADNPKSRIGGIYAYNDYVSLEFAKGVCFADPSNHLEGAGKSRRHVKLRSSDEVKTKTCKRFLKQAVTLSQIG